jgi:glycosyltransferase involved in cell wall biosynthesis
VAGAVRLDETSGWLAGAGLDADVIPNFIPDELVVDDVPPAGADAPLLFAGDLVPDKGIHVLLDAYRRLDDPPRLVLAGRPTPEVASTLPDGVHLAGALPHGDVLEYFRSARAVIVPSVWSDPCPTVVLEAMAAGRPVVAAASGGILDMVVDGNTGLLVPPGDAPALARAILTILENPRTAHAFGVAGRDRARQFTVSAVVERIEHMYLDAIDAVAATGSEVAHVG